MEWSSIAQQISEITGESLGNLNPRPISGGSINDAWLLQGDGQRYFVKLNNASRLAMFEAEMEGLQAIHQSQTIRVPEPLCCGVAGSHAFIVMEYIEMGSGGNHEQLGQQLAAMHRVTGERFGWHRNNTIGSTLQQNGYMDDWVEFWREQRLGFQLKLAEQNGYGRVRKSGDRLLEALPQLLAGHDPEPSLLHGDLWSGNYGFDSSGSPIIFDPALYYGDRETDLAMTELFGGFSSTFYHAYQEAYPLDEGYETRKRLYNLYHILNHVNLFGSGYLGQAESLISGLLAAS